MFTGECKYVCCVYCQASSAHYICFYSSISFCCAASTKCFSLSSLRLITSGTTGLQRVTESEFTFAFSRTYVFSSRPQWISLFFTFFLFLSFFLRLCSEVPLLEDTLMRILVIGLSRDLPLGPADAMELADHLVKRAAAVQSDGARGSAPAVAVYKSQMFALRSGRMF